MKIKFNDFAVVLYVKDINRTEQFYKNIIGIDVQRQPSDHEGEWLLAVLENGVQLIFFEGEEQIGRSPVVVFGLEEGYIDDVVDGLSKEGVNIVTPVTEAPGGWTADFQDPDGHPLSLYQEEALPRRKL
ncbi:VOC family protein [Gracilimonas mengyeensis]|uniref:Predicted lactoylglutathione lyase n=1 Tax=Gracilimonas mengyeensis TaxID=1302730 RepID=A0A521FES1_9BACT|nr:VOC family protein [Gracilimonas mengyeensis]SMO94040.1 Predicted lactoylglutathione lyase [Gracilimonas mengyeensis]